MCRHLAHLGRPRTLADLVLDPPHSLATQSWAPRRQRHGRVNVDGFGVGWFPLPDHDLAVGTAPVPPVRYRRAQPIWTDASFASLAPTIRTPCAVAAVRSATAGTSQDESAAAPFTHGRWLFSHNGRLRDWSGARQALLGSAADVPDARAAVDSALLFGLAVAAWQDGADLADGLVAAAQAALEHGGGRLTMLAADGTAIAALVHGEPVSVRQRDDAVTLASEPDDDDPGWRELPDDTVVRFDAGGGTQAPLRAAPHHAAP